jgi:hypothetical protein
MIRFRQNKKTSGDPLKYKNFDLLLSAYRYRKAAEEDTRKLRRTISWSFSFVFLLSLLIVYQIGNLKLSEKNKIQTAVFSPENTSFEQKQMKGVQYSSFETDASVSAIVTLLNGVRLYIPAYSFYYPNKMLVEGKVEILFAEYPEGKYSYEIYAFKNGTPVFIKEKIVVERPF